MGKHKKQATLITDYSSSSACNIAGISFISYGGEVAAETGLRYSGNGYYNQVQIFNGCHLFPAIRES